MSSIKGQPLEEALIFDTRYATRRMEQDISYSIPTTSDSTVIFEQIFKDNFKDLHGYACSILKDSDDAEEIVQNVFFKLWEKREKIPTLNSVPAYLYRSVHNECLNSIKHNKVKADYQSHSLHVASNDTNTSDNTTTKELEHRIHDAINSLPEQCRTIFQLSRFEELKYREIADKLGLSVKTVENQMGKALKVMRTKLADFLPSLILVLLNLLNEIT
ncbi:MAG: RNA polymerase sigma-70 factor [Flavipsychrobacter sp.]